MSPGASPLPLLQELKQAKQIRYIEDVDFHFYWHYSIVHPKRKEIEEQLLRHRDQCRAVVVMISFGSGAVFRKVGQHPLPPWAAELGVTSWAQFALKYVISHPAVVSATPGTTKLKHLIDNLGAAQGLLPDEAMRRKMAAHVDSL